jgi:hypothetical protein
MGWRSGYGLAFLAWICYCFYKALEAPNEA